MKKQRNGPKATHIGKEQISESGRGALPSYQLSHICDCFLSVAATAEMSTN